MASDTENGLSGVSTSVAVRWPEGLRKDDFFRSTLAIAAAAHELKTPLAVIGGYTKLLLEETIGPLNEQQRTVVREMDESATRFQRFIHDFLAFSALEAGKHEPTFQLGDINACIREAIETWKTRFEHHDIALVFLPGTDIPEIRFDELKIQHVMSNFLDNALKFTPAGGTVTVNVRPYFWERRTARLRPQPQVERRKEVSRQDNSIRIDVRDTGPGVPAEHYLEIFDDFQQIDPSRKSQGMGLGLAIVKRLVEAHHGKVWVESERTRGGAIFSFLLPMS